MIHFRPGSHVHRLVMMLSFVGEYPVYSLHLLGKERVYKALVHKLTTTQTFRNDQTRTEYTCRLLTATGRGGDKTIRLYKAALVILEWIHPDAYRYYMASFWNHRFPGDAAHRERNHRVAEVAIICMRSGLEARPYLLPRLQNKNLCQILPKGPVLYLSKDLKRVGEAEMNKTIFTRMIGAVFYEGGCYAVYNTRGGAMKWSGMGEFKAMHNLIEIGRMNAGAVQVDSAVLIGKNSSIALKTLLESDKSRRLEFRFDSIYQHIYFIAMDRYGRRQLRILVLSNWKEKLLTLLFEPEERVFHQGLFEYDAYVNGIYVFSHLDGDLARLIRFREAIESGNGQYEVLCYPHQISFLREYLDQRVCYKTIDMDSVEAALGLILEE